MQNTNKWLMSSVGDGSLSLTIKGVILGSIPFVIAILQHYGIQVAEQDLAQIVNNIFSIISIAMITFGLARKVVNALK